MRSACGHHPAQRWRTGKLFTGTRPAQSFVVFVILNTSRWDNESPDHLLTVSHIPRSLQLHTRSALFRLFSFLKIWIWHSSQPVTSPFTSAHKVRIPGNKMPTRCNRWFLLQILLLAQHVSGTTMPIIRSSRVLYNWLLPVVFGVLVFKLSVWCGAESCVFGLRAAAIKIICCI